MDADKLNNNVTVDFVSLTEAGARGDPTNTGALPRSRGPVSEVTATRSIIVYLISRSTADVRNL